MLTLLLRGHDESYNKGVTAPHCPDLPGDALAALARCLELAPTLPELYSCQARVLKHAGDPQGAAAAAVKAQSLDLADRRGGIPCLAAL